jgi:hypothetical protein
MAVNPFDTLTDQDIQTAMANSNGVRHPLFIPGQLFASSPRPQLPWRRVFLRSAGQEANLAPGTTRPPMRRLGVRRDDPNGECELLLLSP